ncbi:MAG: arsenate reductase ArsC [Flavobacteriales bacterium]|nr:arsenate reductase ArsC [Flavobacteriales bacterium]MCX7650233.1 arsenate reductase ArsC [Flavobacteriales bacterium]MDW8431345.1 arsenate reductase ArsC [Flavobacteriales bacterium]
MDNGFGDMKKIRVLVLCTGNSCRSQMAEGYLKHFGGEALEVYSAGVEAHGLNPLAVKIMEEDGVDISHHSSDTLDRYSHLDFDYVITVCDNARERCPWMPARVKHVHRNFPDPARETGPAEEVLRAFRSVRDSIKAFCLTFIEELGIPTKTQRPPKTQP